MCKPTIKRLILFLILLLPSGQAFNAIAGIPPVPKLPVTNAGISALAKSPRITLNASARIASSTLSPQVSAQITKTLQKRVLTSGAHFEQTRDKYPKMNPKFLAIRWVSGESLSQNLTVSPEVLYPQAPFLQNQEQLGLYFLAQNNRAQSHWYPKLVTWYQEIVRRLDDFKKNQLSITHPIEKDVSWIAQQLPEDISYLLLGECHYLPDIPKNVTELISYIHKVLQPEREIIVLTEFLPEIVTWGYSGPVSTWEIYTNLWKSLEEMGIPIIGMESDFTFNDFNSKIVSSEPEIATESYYAKILENKDTDKILDTSQQAASSLEGIRLRNAHFMQIIQQTRQNHPDALFIIYTGGGHVEYSYPYSLGDALAGPTTRVISLSPAPVMAKGQWQVPGISFDVATNARFAFDRLVQFNDPELTRLSGADIRWRIPITQGVKW
ncbi:MAG: hypothetical protein IKP06_03690 [Elusimicrobiaceae bacterium]|nr:hypothetical protein [Elusimicrobiaceae bacterium]